MSKKENDDTVESNKQPTNEDQGNSQSIEDCLMERFKLTDVEWVIVNAFDYTTSNGIQAKAYATPYIKKESAERRADEVFGSVNWRNTFSMPDQNGRFKFVLEFRDSREAEWNRREAGGSIDLNAKGGFSDNAFEVALSFAEKRAWSKVGIGRYLKLVPQIEVQVSDGWKEGWNHYSFRSKVDKNEYRKIYWREPQLPDWALHAEDNYEGVPATADPDMPTEDEALPADQGQWIIIMKYYESLPPSRQEQWHPKIFEDEVEDSTGEVINSKRRKISKSFADKVIDRLEGQYGKLNDDDIPQKIAEYQAQQKEKEETESPENTTPKK